MMRIFLVTDDYNEMIFIQSVLKKTGFDVDALMGERGFATAYLTFHPEIVLFSLRSSNYGMDLLKNVKQKPKAIVFVPQNKIDSQTDLDQADYLLPSPINVQDLLKSIAQLGNLPFEPILEKYNRIRSTLTQSGSIATEGSAREQRMQAAIKNLEPSPHQNFGAKFVRDVVKQVRKEETTENVEELDEDRRNFVRKLFKRPSS